MVSYPAFLADEKSSVVHGRLRRLCPRKSWLLLAMKVQRSSPITLQPFGVRLGWDRAPRYPRAFLHAAVIQPTTQARLTYEDWEITNESQTYLDIA